MRICKRKTCSNYKPLPEIPHIFLDEPKCSHCAYFSTKNCRKDSLDALDYPDDEIF